MMSIGHNVVYLVVGGMGGIGVDVGLCSVQART